MQRGVLYKVAATVALVLGVSAVQFGGAGTVSAAPVTLGCEVTFGGVDVPLDVTVDTDDPALAAYGDGTYLALHDAYGNFSSVPATSGEMGTPPVCAVEVQRDANGVVSFGEPTWMWCTDIDADVCVGGPGTAPAPTLSDLQPDDPSVLPDSATWLSVEQKSSLVGWAAHSADSDGVTEFWDLQAWQNRIWCITDGTSHIETGDPGPYVPGDPATATCAGFRTWLQANILPLLALPSDHIELSVSTGGATTTVGNVLRLSMSSTQASVRMGANVADTVTGQICPESTTGASFADSTVTMTPNTTTELCAFSDREGSFSIVGASELVRPSYAGNLVRFEAVGCQIFVSGDTPLDPLESQGVVLSWTAEQPATTTPTTAPAAPRSLAFTG